MIFTFPNFTFDIDVEKTQAYYNSDIEINCECNGCRNWKKAIDTLPIEVTDFFAKMGVDMRKFSEVYVNCTNADDTVYYGGFTHVCGKVIRGESAWIPNSTDTKYWDDEKVYFLTSDFRVSYTEDCSLVGNNFPEPIIQIEISADLPWVLEELNEYGKDPGRRKPK